MNSSASAAHTHDVTFDQATAAVDAHDVDALSHGAPPSSAECEIRVTERHIASNGQHLVSVWRDPAPRVRALLRTDTGYALFADLDTDTLRIDITSTIHLGAAGAHVERGWRTEHGDELIAWTSGFTHSQSHLGRRVGDTIVPIGRGGEPYDDPSRSRLARSTQLLDTRAGLPTPIAARVSGWQAVLPEGTVTDTAWVSPDGGRRVFVSQWGLRPALMLGVGTYADLLLLGPNHGILQQRTDGGVVPIGGNCCASRGSAGLPDALQRVFLAMNDGGVGLALWVGMAAGVGVGLIAQRVTSSGVAADWVVSAVPQLGLPSIWDMSVVGGEAWVTASEPNARAPVTHLIRFDLDLPRDHPLVVPVQQLPIGQARILPIGGDRVLFWSPDSGTAFVADCATLRRIRNDGGRRARQSPLHESTSPRS